MKKILFVAAIACLAMGCCKKADKCCQEEGCCKDSAAVEEVVEAPAEEVIDSTVEAEVEAPAEEVVAE